MEAVFLFGFQVFGGGFSHLAWAVVVQSLNRRLLFKGGTDIVLKKKQS
jgi:hypothetical protein